MGRVRADRLVAVLLLLQQRGQVTATEVAERAGDLRAHGPARPRRPRHGRDPRVLDPGPQRRVAPGRRRAHRPHRPQRRRGPGAVPRRRAVVGRHPAAPGARCASSCGRCPNRCGPTPRRRRRAIHIDPTSWDHDGRRAPSAAGPPRRRSQDAVVAGRQVDPRLRGARRRAPRRAPSHPLGIAAKGSVWYLVAGTADGQRYVPGRPGDRGRGARRAGRAAGRIRPRGRRGGR